MGAHISIYFSTPNRDNATTTLTKLGVCARCSRSLASYNDIPSCCCCCCWFWLPCAYFRHIAISRETAAIATSSAAKPSRVEHLPQARNAIAKQQLPCTVVRMVHLNKCIKKNIQHIAHTHTDKHTRSHHTPSPRGSRKQQYHRCVLCKHRNQKYTKTRAHSRKAKGNTAKRSTKALSLRNCPDPGLSSTPHPDNHVGRR